MPKNLKEEIIFTLTMAGLMVLVMTGYNIVLNEGLSSKIGLIIIAAYPLGLAVALVFDIFIVGPIAKTIVFKGIYRNGLPDNPIKIGIPISVLMVLGMVTLMSMFGLVENVGLSHFTASLYGGMWIRNFVVALPLQLLIVGPIARAILKKVQLRQELIVD